MQFTRLTKRIQMSSTSYLDWIWFDFGVTTMELYPYNINVVALSSIYNKWSKFLYVFFENTFSEINILLFPRRISLFQSSACRCDHLYTHAHCIWISQPARDSLACPPAGPEVGRLRRRPCTRACCGRNDCVITRWHARRRGGPPDVAVLGQELVVRARQWPRIAVRRAPCAVCELCPNDLYAHQRAILLCALVGWSLGHVHACVPVHWTCLHYNNNKQLRCCRVCRAMGHAECAYNVGRTKYDYREIEIVSHSRGRSPCAPNAHLCIFYCNYFR